MNPYLVLGVQRGASLFEIKKAYHDAVKRCHPDKFAGTPEYYAAQEELKQVNLAYDMLHSSADEVRVAAARQTAQSANGSQGEDARYDGGDHDERTLRYAYDLAMGRRINEALLLLNKTKRRGARWYYVHSLCRKKAGVLADAIVDIEIAMKLEPGNLDYRDEWRSVIALRSRKRKRAVAIGAAATAAVVVTVVITI